MTGALWFVLVWLAALGCWSLVNLVFALADLAALIFRGRR